MGRVSRPDLTMSAPRSGTEDVATRERANEVFSLRVVKTSNSGSYSRPVPERRVSVQRPTNCLFHAKVQGHLVALAAAATPRGKIEETAIAPISFPSITNRTCSLDLSACRSR